VANHSSPWAGTQFPLRGYDWFYAIYHWDPDTLPPTRPPF